MSKKRHPFIQYFQDLWLGISTTYAGMKLTLGYFFKPKVTMIYPEERPVIPEGHRGLHKYIEEQCTLCMACVNACPVDCIVIEAVGRGKDSLKKVYSIDYSKCMFCNLCCEACRPGCLYMSEYYDMASAERDKCLVHFARTKSPEEIKAFEEKLLQKEAERKAKAAVAETEAKEEAPGSGKKGDE